MKADPKDWVCATHGGRRRGGCPKCRAVVKGELPFSQLETLQIAKSMSATTVDEARRALYSAGYSASFQEIEAVINARNVLGSREWAPGDELLVVAEGALFLGVMKEPRPDGKSLVRLVHGDEWLEVEHDRLFPLTEVQLACARGLGVQP